MKYVTEYRESKLAKEYLSNLHKIATKKWNIMEICGGQTHSLVKNGILSVLPHNINMIHGPGCPVCVTPQHLIDAAIHLAKSEKAILCSFGDMLRVPGSSESLLEAKAKGADVRIVYSPLDAVKIAKENPTKEVVFFAVGFETTAPANALSVLHAQRAKLKNYSILTSHVLVPPAMNALLNDEENVVHAFLAAGHVCAIMGINEYHSISKEHKVPIVVTGFEPIDLLQGIIMVTKQLEEGRFEVENQYSRAVSSNGNPNAVAVMMEVFEIADREWRGIGNIDKSGLEVRPEFALFDAKRKFNIAMHDSYSNNECIAGEILRGIKKPHECKQFGKKCTPEFPLGAPMVSSEGACAAYYHFR